MEIFFSDLAQIVMKHLCWICLKNLLLFFIAIASLSQSANLTRLADAPALMIGFWRILGACLCMISLQRFATLKRSENFLQQVPTRTWLWTFFSGTFFFFHLWTFFLAAQNTTIANCMVLYSSNPVFTALGSWLFLKDRFERRHLIAFILAFSGISILAWGHLDFSHGMTGEIYAILSAALYSAYIMTGKKVRYQMSNEQYSWIIYAWTALLFLCAALSKSVILWGYPSVTWWAIGGTILFPTLLGHVLFSYLLKYLNINWMSCGKLLEPGMSAFVAGLLFHETLSPNTVLAFVLTISAGFVLLQPYLRRSKLQN